METSLQTQNEFYQGEDLMSVHDAACIALNNIRNLEKWDSLIVNLRKPHTYRAFMYYGDHRICLHRFSPCLPVESFQHPHPWPCRVLVLQGKYEMEVAHSKGRDQFPQDVMTTTLSSGSSYSITSPLTWHAVRPATMCYSLMVNGRPWSPEQAHESAPTTKGKDLDKFSELDLKVHLVNFETLLSHFLDK